jgi:hypothetical protein
MTMFDFAHPHFAALGLKAGSGPAGGAAASIGLQQR